MIRKARLTDIDDILRITKSCARHMTSQDIHQWNENYPNKQAFISDVERDELYVLKEQNNIIGCIVVSAIMDEEYLSIQWLTPNDNNVYIHRVAIDPEYQGQGNAQKLMAFAEQFAKENNYKSVRLDTFSQNQRNQKFYEHRDYKKLGDIYFPKQSEHPFCCYELVL
mgnify:CR=1 FL=1